MTAAIAVNPVPYLHNSVYLQLVGIQGYNYNGNFQMCFDSGHYDKCFQPAYDTHPNL